MSLERIVAALIAMLLLATAIVVVRRAWSRLGTPVDVVCLLLAVWGGVLLLFAVPVIDYATTGLVAWLAIYGSIAATAAGCLLAWRRQRTPPLAIDEQQDAMRETIDPRRLRVLWIATAALGFVGFAAFVYSVHLVAGWQTVFADPSTVRNIKRDSLEFQREYGFWKLLTYCNQMAFILWTVGLRMRVFTGAWRVPGMLGFASLLPFAFTADRHLLAAALALTWTVHLLWPWRGSWRRVAIASGVAIVLAGGALAAIGNRYGGALDQHPEVASSVTWRALDPVAIPYLYLTANIPTFGQLTEDELAPLTLGQMTLLPAVKATARAGVIDAAPVATGVFYPIPFEAFSNYSWLGVFWLDFRVIGVLLLPLLVGFVTTAARLRLAAQPSFLLLWTGAILLYVVVYSPLSNVLYVSMTWQYLLVGPLMAAVLQPGSLGRAVRAARTRAQSATALEATALGVTALAAFAVIALAAWTRGAPTQLLATSELRQAVARAQLVYERSGTYPGSRALATRLGVNRPEVAFRGQSFYTDPLPPPGIVAVFTQPQDVFMRVRAADGRVYEVHRTEADGGATFGPGTRDR